MSSTIGRIVQIPVELIGASDRRYSFKELLQDKPPLGSVWVATQGQVNFVLKDIPESIFSNFNERIWPQLRQNSSPLLRLPIDTIPGRRTLVYQYMMDDFLNLVKSKISMLARRQILKTTLQAISDMHDRDIVHLDVKPDNIMVDCEHRGAVCVVKQVKIIDLENAAHLPHGRCIKGMLAGNDNWRSIEAHFRGELSKPSDVFSFGLVCLYAMFGRVTCGPDEDFRLHESQGDEETNCQILSMLWDERNEEYIPYKPFSEWPEVEHDETFKDLIKRLMDLDPGRRITASQALRHPWFGAEID